MRPGEVIAERLTLIAELGRGEGSVVWGVRDAAHNGMERALKFLGPRVANSPRLRASMLSALRSAARVEHPNVHRVEESIQLPDGRLGLLMPKWSGQPLAETCRERRLGPGELRRITLDLLGALSAAHRYRVWHQDIDPTNVLVEPTGRAMLVNLGMVCEDGTRVAGGMGKPGFLAPEMYEGAYANARSDLYSLAAVLYLAATGQAAFGGGDTRRVLAAQMAGEFTPVGAVRKDLPDALAAAINACLALDPLQRPASAANLASDISAGRVVEVTDLSPRPDRSSTPMGALAPGDFTLLLREEHSDLPRRRLLRRRSGPILPGEKAAPERALSAAVHRLARLPPPATAPSTLRRPEFLLVKGVSAPTAAKLQRAATRAGFLVHVTQRKSVGVSHRVGERELGTAAALGVLAVMLTLGGVQAWATSHFDGLAWLALSVVVTGATAMWQARAGRDLRRIELVFPRVLMENTEHVRVARALPDSPLGKSHRRCMRQVRKAEELVDLYAKRLEPTHRDQLVSGLGKLRTRLNNAWAPTSQVHALLYRAQLAGQLGSPDQLASGKPKHPDAGPLAKATALAPEAEGRFATVASVMGELAHSLRDAEHVKQRAPDLVRAVDSQVGEVEALLSRMRTELPPPPTSQRGQAHAADQLHALLAHSA